MHLQSTQLRFSFLTALIAAASLFSACRRENVLEICQEPRCLQYEATWRQLLQSRNGMSDAWFEKHIHIVHSYLLQQQGLGESYVVWYNINLDWASVRTADAFVIHFDTAAPDSVHRFLPTGVDLDATQIGMAADSFLLDSRINVITPVEALAYDTELGARRALEHKTGLSLRTYSVVLGVPNSLVPADGHLRLMGKRRTNDEISCEAALIDLVTTGTRKIKVICNPY